MTLARQNETFNFIVTPKMLVKILNIINNIVEW